MGGGKHHHFGFGYVSLQFTTCHTLKHFNVNATNNLTRIFCLDFIIIPDGVLCCFCVKAYLTFLTSLFYKLDLSSASI